MKSISNIVHNYCNSSDNKVKELSKDRKVCTSPVMRIKDLSGYQYFTLNFIFYADAVYI